jgi:hypothetical protein
MATIDATVGGANANSFETHAEANVYFGNRIPITPAWVASGEEAYLITATRLLCNLNQPYKTFFAAQGGNPAYYRVRRQWLGTPATTTQRLAFPRVGCFDSNGNPVDPTIVPQDIKDAESEFAGQLLAGDRSQDNSVIIQGLNSVKAGSVALGFNKDIIAQVIPQAVYDMLTSYLSDEIFLLANSAFFEVGSADPTREASEGRSWGWE